MHAGTPETFVHDPANGQALFTNSPYDKYPEKSIPAKEIIKMIISDFFDSISN